MTIENSPQLKSVCESHIVFNYKKLAFDSSEVKCMDLKDCWL